MLLGYGLFMSLAHIMSKPVYKNLGYDIERDFTPIIMVSDAPMLVVVNASSPFNSMKDLIAGAAIDVIADAGHLPNIDQPAAFNAALLRHFASCL